MISETMESYEEMKLHNHYIDQVFYNILINGIMKQKDYELAYKVWQEMNNQGFRYNDFTISVTIQLFSNLNKQK
jgi:pentatricopeptide repeat protein